MRKSDFIGGATPLVVVIAVVVILFSLEAHAQQATVSQTLRGHVPSAIARFHLHPLHDLAETNQLRLAISLPLRNQQALDELLRQIYDPRSTNYHHYLTPSQFTARFGPSQQDYDAVIQFMASNGLTVAQTHSDRMLVDVTGSVGTIQKVFHTTMRVYQHPVENRTFFAPDTDPVINLSVPIKHIDGLDNFFIPHPEIKRASPSNSRSGISRALGSGPSGEYMGKDFRAAYVPGVALDGAGQTVGLFELDGYYASDITFYEQTNSLPLQTLVNVAVDGGVSTSGSGADEVSLDIEMIVSMATNLSEVLVYEAPNNGVSTADLLSEIASSDVAKQISSSWAIGDSSTYDGYYQKMAAQGQSFFQASGDDGAYYDGIEEWADDTNITLVGGTTLYTSGPHGSWTNEVVWNWYSTGLGTDGSGGGVNFNNVAIPSWQQPVGMTNNMGSTTLRNVPDVALTADNIYVVYGGGQSGGFGGTSCAAPLWAAFTAMVNQKAVAEGLPTVGFINPAVYAIGLSADYTNCFHDITTGNNTNTVVGPSKYYATNGYDLCTGWGTPNGSNLINALTVPPDSLTVVPGKGFTAIGSDGGPFAPSSQTYGLTNVGGSTLEWSLGNTSSWLAASSTNGALAAGTGTNVTISVTTNANSLASGTYAATLVFTNVSSNLVVNLQFTLEVVDPLIIAPSSSLSAIGPEGGPFTVSSETFALTNVGAVALNWQATGSTWLNLSPPNGTLAGGANTTVNATLNASARNLITGTYTGQVSFTDERTAFIQNFPISLSIGQTIVLNGGFETGNFTDWTVDANTTDTFVDNGSTTGIPPHSGSYLAALGQDGSLGYLSQTLPTVTGQSYLLSVWFYPPIIRRGNNTPNQFVVLWNGTTQFDVTNLPELGAWTNKQFIVTATGPQTVLEIGGRDDPSWLGLDDVNAWPIPSPNIQGVSRAGNKSLSITWYSMTNLEYELQYSTNLASQNWLNLNTYTATGPVISVTNPIGTNTAVFYRVLQLP
ncbi:MAG TPA: protease pro-enzyme activation domain-containing protein [Candidatus Sulfotelmatobacter sp.]|nr:protease pro-enzyme activation domain-containing protein [Candidatus Sulfotelmatobacter sp.]